MRAPASTAAVVVAAVLAGSTVTSAFHHLQHSTGAPAPVRWRSAARCRLHHVPAGAPTAGARCGRRRRQQPWRHVWGGHIRLGVGANTSLGDEELELLEPSGQFDVAVGVDDAAVAAGAGRDAAGGSISYLGILKFVIPTLGIWLAGPIMSLVDTAVVGQRSSIDLAALGPATNLCDSLIYGCAFLSIATTNLLAGALASDTDKQSHESQKIVSQALAVGLTFGVGLSLSVLLFGTRMMLWSAGGNAAIAPIALQYSKVRMLGAPACLASMIAQAACLGSKDSVTPLFVVLACGAFNAVGDVFLVKTLSMGIRGAAIATAVSEVIGTALLMRAVAKMQGPRSYPLVSIPGWQDFLRFMFFAGPIFITLLCKILFYSGMTVLVTSGADTSMIAAHTCLLKIFFLFTTVGDSLSQAAQAFLPGMFATDRHAAQQLQEQRAADAAAGLRDGNGSGSDGEQLGGRKLPSAGNAMIRKLLTLAVAVGVCMGLGARLVPLKLPHLFTNDLDITAQMHRLVPFLSWSLLVHAAVMALEGCLLAKRELAFLARTYLFNAVLAVGGLMAMAGWTAGNGLTGAWIGLLLFQVIRLVQFSVRLALVKQKERRAAAALAVA